MIMIEDNFNIKDYMDLNEGQIEELDSDDHFNLINVFDKNIFGVNDLFNNGISKNSSRKKQKDKERSKLILIDYSEEVSNLIWHYETPTHRYGRCTIGKSKSKRNYDCQLCGDKIKKHDSYYYPVLWDRIINHAFCSECFWKEFDRFISF